MHRVWERAVDVMAPKWRRHARHTPSALWPRLAVRSSRMLLFVQIVARSAMIHTRCALNRRSSGLELTCPPLRQRLTWRPASGRVRRPLESTGWREGIDPW